MKANYPKLSYWETSQYFKGIDRLIIGSGIVGLSAAIHLKEKQPGLNILVVERGPLPAGASTRNAGFACFGSPSELIEDLATHSEDEVFDLVEKRWKGLLQLRKRLGDAAIGYQEWGGFELFRKGEKNEFERCMEQLSYLNKQVASIIGKKEVYQNVDQQIGNYGFAGVSNLLVNTAEGQIDTGKMVKALIAKARALDIEILNGLTIDTLDSTSGEVVLALSNGWEIKVPKVLVCTNGFAKELLPDLKVKPARNQVLITKPIPGLKIKGCFHYDKGYYYFRNIDSRILFGGGRNLSPEVEQTNSFGTTSLIKEELEKLLKTMIFPGRKVEIDRWWSGILGVGDHKTPIINEVSPNVFVAVRMGGMGIAIGSLIGEEGAELMF